MEHFNNESVISFLIFINFTSILSFCFAENSLVAHLSEKLTIFISTRSFFIILCSQSIQINITLNQLIPGHSLHTNFFRDPFYYHYAICANGLSRVKLCINFLLPHACYMSYYHSWFEECNILGTIQATDVLIS